MANNKNDLLLPHSTHADIDFVEANRQIQGPRGPGRGQIHNSWGQIGKARRGERRGGEERAENPR